MRKSMRILIQMMTSALLAAEHMQTWPGGRTNHYFFDMNRDFFAQTQPETRARIKVLQQWVADGGTLIALDNAVSYLGSDLTGC